MLPNRKPPVTTSLSDLLSLANKEIIMDETSRKLQANVLMGQASSKSSKPDKTDANKEAVKERTALRTAWLKKYAQLRIGPYGKINVKEKTSIKRLHASYGYDTVRSVMIYYLENYKDILYIKGYPSIAALEGFRKTLFPEFINGARVDVKKGQFEGAIDYSKAVKK